MSNPVTHGATIVESAGRWARDPVPNAGCDVCAALESQRADARRAGDGSTVSDCNVEIRRHPHEAGARA